ncbi:MAG: cobalt-precorrin-5B (C(1))-methyltransferase [Methanolinea sp.]|nr:cobalt-precorrin-5B (C(1))-methyltransferase [Methanolinea sp.]
MPRTTSSDRNKGTLRDPVTGFVYHESWIRGCTDPDDLELVRTGLGLLTSSGKVLKRGFSTGTTAAAACKAAILSLRNPVECVDVTIPCGLTVAVHAEGRNGTGSARKYSGDYPSDATAGMEFLVKAVPAGEGIVLVAAEGIGRFERDTPRYAAGEPAISQPALQSILRAIEESMGTVSIPGIELELSAPEGPIVAKRTLNPRVGVKGGISVLGTTGLVEPWDEHLTGSVLEQVAAADRVVLTTGRLGLRYSGLLFPDHEVVLAGSHLSEALECARGEVILCGLPGLILRFLSPGILEGSGCGTVEELSTRPEFRVRMGDAFALAKKHYPGLRVIIVSREGEILGDSA